MDLHLWIPFAISIGSLFICLVVLLYMPETLVSPISKVNPEPENSATLRHRNISILSDISIKANSDGLMKILKLKNTLFVLPVFFISTFRPTTLNVLLQYTSVRFGWKLSKTSVLISEVAGVNIVLFLLVLPLLTQYIRSKHRTQPSRIDLAVARGSLLMLFAGAVLLGLAPKVNLMIPSLIVFTAGFGSRVSTLSLLTSWVHTEARGRVYGVVSVVENLGVMVGEPMLQGVFAASLGFPSFWLGTPFFCCAALYAIAGLCTLMVRLNQGPICIS